MKRSEYIALQIQATELVNQALPYLKVKPGQIEIAGFGMDDGVHLLALVNIFNETFCGKLLISLPGWICPAHHHLAVDKQKDEGFLVIYGLLIVTEPDGARHEIPAGTQTLYMLAGVIHQLSAGPNGAVYFEFSEADTRTDVFPYDRVTRDPEIEEDVEGYTPPKGGFKILGDEGVRLVPHVGVVSHLSETPVRV